MHSKLSFMAATFSVPNYCTPILVKIQLKNSPPDKNYSHKHFPATCLEQKKRKREHLKPKRGNKIFSILGRKKESNSLSAWASILQSTSLNGISYVNLW